MKKLILIVSVLFITVGCTTKNESYLKDYEYAYNYTIEKDNETFTSSGMFQSYANVLKYESEEINLYVEAYTIDSVEDQTDDSEVYYKFMVENKESYNIEFLCNGKTIRKYIGIKSVVGFIAKPDVDLVCDEVSDIEVRIDKRDVVQYSETFNYYQYLSETNDLSWNNVDNQFKNDITIEGKVFLSIIFIVVLIYGYKALYNRNLERYVKKGKKVLKLPDVRTFAVTLVVLGVVGVSLVSIVNSINNNERINTLYLNTIDYSEYIDRVYEENDNYYLDLNLNKLESSIYGNFGIYTEGYKIDIYFDDEIRPVDHRDIIHVLPPKNQRPSYNINYDDISNYNYMYVIIYDNNSEIVYLKKIELEDYK